MNGRSGQISLNARDSTAEPMALGGQFDRLGFHDGGVGISPRTIEQADTERDLFAAVLAARPHFELRGAGEVKTAILVAPVVGRVLPGHADPAEFARVAHAYRMFPFVHMFGGVAVQRQ